MKAVRVVPCLDVADGRVTKCKQFVDIQDVGDPVQLAAHYDAGGADELVFYDITASHEQRNIMVDVVERTAEQVFIPFMVGGGIRSVEDARRMLRAGADKISLNSPALRDPDIINAVSTEFGSQCAVLSMDVKRRNGMDVKRRSGTDVKRPEGMDVKRRNGLDVKHSEGTGETYSGGWDVYMNGGRIETGRDALEWAEEGIRRGAGEIVLNSMDQDGTRAGYDLELLRAMNELADVPIVASGGVGSMQHLADGARAGADAVLAASVFHFGDFSVADAKTFLATAGIPVRPVR